MPVHPLKIAAGLFAAGLLACAPAQAASANATASLNNISFQLIDLDLTDNISPSITFVYTDAASSLDFVGGGVVESASSADYGSMNKVLTYGGGSVQNGAASMHADLHIDAAPGAWGSAASASQLLTFTLSPSTRLLFTAEAEVLMQKDGIDFGVASALLSGSVGSSIDGVWGTESFNSKLSSTEGLRNQVLQGVLNTGAQIGRGSLSASLTTIFQKHSDVTPIPQDISAVPEPETYGMLLAGLLVVGSVARGKRRGQARQA